MGLIIITQSNIIVTMSAILVNTAFGHHRVHRSSASPNVRLHSGNAVSTFENQPATRTHRINPYVKGAPSASPDQRLSLFLSQKFAPNVLEKINQKLKPQQELMDATTQSVAEKLYKIAIHKHGSARVVRIITSQAQQQVDPAIQLAAEAAVNETYKELSSRHQKMEQVNWSLIIDGLELNSLNAS